MRSCCGTWVGLRAVGKGPGILGAVLGPGLMVACELSISVSQLSLRGWQRGAWRSHGSVQVRGGGGHSNSLLRLRGAGVCAASPEALRVLMWLGSGCSPVGEQVTPE